LRPARKKKRPSCPRFRKQRPIISLKRKLWKVDVRRKGKEGKEKKTFGSEGEKGKLKRDGKGGGNGGGARMLLFWDVGSGRGLCERGEAR